MLRNDHMDFAQNKSIEKWGEKLGYIFSYFLFTTLLFLILTLLRKLGSWTYFDVMGIAIVIAFIGALLKRFLK